MKHTLLLSCLAACSTPQAPLIGKGLMSSYAVDFGNIAVGEVGQQTVAFSNGGNSAHRITSINPPSDAEFKLGVAAGTPFPANGVLNAPVTFTPQNAGAKSGTIVVHTDDPEVPTITLNLSGEGVVSSCLVAPATVDFGTVVVGTTATVAVQLTNASDLDCIITPGAVAGPQAALFTFDQSMPFTVSAGDSAAAHATYAPLVPSSNDSASVTLSASAGGSVQIVFRGTAVQSCLQITPGALDFGFVQPGSAATLSLSMENVCNVSIDVTPALVVNAGSPAAFSGMSSGSSLHPGDVQTVQVTFAPTTLQKYDGELDVGSTDSNSVTPVDLSGFGGGAVLACAPLLDFQTVAANVGSTLPLICTNSGTDVPGHPEAGLSLTSVITDDAVFSALVDANSLPQPLAAGQSLVVDVSFLPTGAGGATGTLEVLSDANPLVPVTAALSGTAILEPGPCEYSLTPSSVNFGQVRPGTPITEGFTISNNGPNECLITALQLSPGTSPDFTLPNGPVVSQRLAAPGGGGPYPSQLSVPIAATCGASGGSGSLEFTISGPGAGHEVIPLSCGATGTSCFLLQPAALDFGTVGTNNGELCETQKLIFMGVNGCASDVAIQSLSFSSGGVAYSVVSASLPQTVPRGGESGPIEIDFAPPGTGTFADNLLVQTDLQDGPFYLALNGAAIDGGTHTDVFTGIDYLLPLTSQPDPSTFVIFFDGPPPDQTPEGGISGVLLPETNPDGSSNWTYKSVVNSIDINPSNLFLQTGDSLYVTYSLVCP